MKKILILAIIFSSNVWATELTLNFDQNTGSSQCNSTLLAKNTVPVESGCCDQHKGVCGCGPDGIVCCDGTGVQGCPCDESKKK